MGNELRVPPPDIRAAAELVRSVSAAVGAAALALRRVGLPVEVAGAPEVLGAYERARDAWAPQVERLATRLDGLGDALAASARSYAHDDATAVPLPLP